MSDLKNDQLEEQDTNQDPATESVQEVLGAFEDEAGGYTPTGPEDPDKAEYAGPEDPDPAADPEAADPESTPAVPGVNDETPPALSRDDWADYGLSEADAKALDGIGRLDTVMGQFDRQTLAAGRQSIEAQLPAQPAPIAPVLQQPPVVPQPVPVQPPLPPQAPANPGVVLKGGKEMYGDGFDDMQAMAAAHGTHEVAMQSQAAEIAALRGQLSQFTERMQSQQQAEETVAYDGYFNGLGDEYTAHVGKGTISEIAEGGPEHKTRNEIVDTANTLAAGYQRQGRPIPGRTVLLTRATRVVLGDKTMEVARTQVAERVRNAKGQFVEKPSQRESRPLTGDERAVAYAESFTEE